MEHGEPAIFPSSKRASKASSKPATFPGSTCSVRNGAFQNFVVSVMPRGGQAQNACRQKLLQAIIAGQAKCSAKCWVIRRPRGAQSPSGKVCQMLAKLARMLGVACDITRNNGAAGEMGRALQNKTKTELNAIQTLSAPLSSTADPWLQTTRGKTCAHLTSSSAAPPRCNHYTSPCAYP